MTLKEKITTTVIPEMKKSLGRDNVMSLPKLKKITVNIGTSAAADDKAFLETMEENLQLITGQKPIRTIARKAISGFGVREGQVVGLKVTLRGQRMYDFLEKLIAIDLPRIRDFRGISKKSVDQDGNLSIGIKEHTVFPEIDQNQVERAHGLEITATTTATNHEEGLLFFTLVGVPFADTSTSN